MTKQEVLTALQPWIARQRRQAWKPVVQGGNGPTTASKFGGTPFLSDDAPWPDCKGCERPLANFAQLDLAALPKELNQQFGTGLLQLFYCFHDDCEDDTGWQLFTDSKSCGRVIDPTAPENTPASKQDEPFEPKQIVDWTSFTDLPMPCEHELLGLQRSYDFQARSLRLQCPELELDVVNPIGECSVEDIAISQEGDKLAGWPAWIQGVEYPNCPRCFERMIQVFQIESKDNIPFMFGDMGCGHITQCPVHKDVVAFGWSCG